MSSQDPMGIRDNGNLTTGWGRSKDQNMVTKIVDKIIGACKSCHRSTEFQGPWWAFVLMLWGQLHVENHLHGSYIQSTLFYGPPHPSSFTCFLQARFDTNQTFLLDWSPNKLCFLQPFRLRAKDQGLGWYNRGWYFTLFYVSVSSL